MKKLEIPKKRESGEMIFQTRLNTKKGENFKEIARKNGFAISDILRSGIDIFMSQYGSKQEHKG
jgi:hypothetical protein